MILKYDGNLDVATGRSRKETSWKNRSTTWAKLVEKISTTHRTAELYQEYLTAKKTRQDEIKDIGGFVGGYLTNGRRKTGNVLHRQLITLDIDFGTPDIWDQFTLLFGNASAIYSTHKHSTETPRYRLILPLDRPVFADEYSAIARYIAGVIDIEAFDSTTFEPSRLMYWPSTAKDADYFFDKQDGPWLIADDILASYHDWHDSSEWPVSSKVDVKVRTDIKKQGDPLEKPGIIGAFNRTYDIHEAIEKYLPDVYRAGDGPDRYSYIEGSSANGLKTYDDKFAFSHHGTDPASGITCNAFDLVRLHKFGLKDEDSKEGTPINKLPSHKAMEDLAAEDSAVRILRANERKADAIDAFKDVQVDEGPVDDTWKGKLEIDKMGNPVSTITNTLLILRNDPDIRGCFKTNEFTRKEILTRNVPWRKVTPATQYFTDVDFMGLRSWLEEIYTISSAPKIDDAIGLVLNENSFHPVREFLEHLSWDGVQRLDTLLIDYLGAEDNVYVRAATRKTFVAAVARVLRPGCKFDYVLTIVGKQGAGKSTIIRKMGGDWYCENLTTVQGKEAAEQLHGVWLMEMGELAGLKKAEVEIIKNFISRQEDSFRPAYGRKKETYPRQCVFIGTTNNRDFLRDPTGNRRFWPVDINEEAATKDIKDDLTQQIINQLWAEAKHYYGEREDLYLPKEIEALAQVVQTDHVESDERAGAVEKYLQTLVPENWDDMNIWDRRAFLNGEDSLLAEGVKAKTHVCAAEIWCELIGGTIKDMNTMNTKPIHTIMQNIPGWVMAKSSRVFKFYGRQRTYVRMDLATNKHRNYNSQVAAKV